MPLSEISSSFPVFNWDSSNGSATAEQTVAACQALENEGSCILFSYLVWNDMIDTLRKLQEALSVAWDEKYASLDDTRMNEADSSLTAARFNSFRYNIDIIWHPGWPWALPSCPSWLQQSARSFLGREDVRGFAQWGEQCDNVYGWYLLELVRKINILIQVFRGDDIAVEMDYRTVFSTLKNAQAGLCNAIALGIACASGSALHGTLDASEIKNLLAWRSGASQIRAALDALEVFSMRHWLNPFSQVFHNIRVAAAACCDYGRKLRSSTTMLRLMPANGVIWFYYFSMVSRQMFSMFPADALDAAYAADYISSETAAVDKADGVIVAGRSADISTSQAHVLPLPIDSIAFLETDTRSKSRSSGSAETVEVENLCGTAVLKASCQAAMTTAFSAGMSAERDMRSDIKAILGVEEEETDWYDPVQTGTNLYIKQTYEDPDQENTNLNITEVFFEPVQDGTNLYIISAASLGGD